MESELAASTVVAGLIHASIVMWIVTLGPFDSVRVVDPEPLHAVVTDIVVQAEQEAVEEPDLVEFTLAEVPDIEPAPERVAVAQLEHLKPVRRPKPIPVRRRVRARRKANLKPITTATAAAYASPAASTAGTELPTAPVLGDGEGTADSDGQQTGPAVSGADEGATDGAAKGEPEVDLKAMLAGYVGRVSSAVHKRFYYPAAGARLGLEGLVVVEVLIDASGKIISSQVVRSSGHRVLDRAALKAMASIGRLPAPPPQLHWGKRSIKVPFDFRLNARRG